MTTLTVADAIAYLNDRPSSATFPGDDGMVLKEVNVLADKVDFVWNYPEGFEDDGNFDFDLAEGGLTVDKVRNILKDVPLEFPLSRSPDWIVNLDCNTRETKIYVTVDCDG